MEILHDNHTAFNLDPADKSVSDDTRPHLIASIMKRKQGYRFEACMAQQVQIYMASFYK